jgi:hypothetical protein
LLDRHRNRDAAGRLATLDLNRRATATRLPPHGEVLWSVPSDDAQTLSLLKDLQHHPHGPGQVLVFLGL